MSGQGSSTGKVTAMTVPELIAALDRLYGAGEGLRVYTTITPGILADFRSMLSRSAVGAPVKEVYRLEDGKGAVYVWGSRAADGTPDIRMSIGS